MPVYPLSSCRARVDSSLDVAVLRRPVLELENWAEIKEEMMVSNVIQRDNVILARKLHPDLEPAAKINDKNVRMRTYSRRILLILLIISENSSKCPGQE